MAESSADVVVVGGGIAGLTTAYYLAKAGVPSVVVERDAIGSHASGFAYGGLSPLSGFGIPGPLAEIAQDGMRLHRELSKSLLDETGIDVDFRVRSSLALAFTEADVRRLKAALPWQQQPGYAVRWLDAADARRVEPRISDETIGATLTEGGGAVEPYRLVLALTRAAEHLGVTVRHGRAIGLRKEGGRVTGVVLEREVLSCATAVLALGPWSAEASEWLGVPIDVRPLKGQILRLQAPPGPPIECSVGWGHNYATTKTDGLLWAGTTEEEAGFDEESTLAARDEIGAALVRMLPSMADAQVAQQTACLRPVASDGLLVLGSVPGLDRVYVATGGARKGILYGPAMGHALANLVLGRNTRIALDAFAPGRFTKLRTA